MFRILIALILAVLLVSPSAFAADKNQPAKEAHDGSVRDLGAIGNRNVGCGRGVGNWYSLERQISMGKSFAAQVESTVKLVKDPVVNEYVNRLGQNLVRNSDAQVPFTIKVIDSDEVNAFALPGGFFYVNSGLILAADNESELAGVMAHEIAHVAACHAARQQTRGQLANLMSIPLIFAGGGIGYTIASVAGLAVPLGFLRFSRSLEADADYLGVEYLYKSGYDPQSFISFFEKVRAREKKKSGFIEKTFETHPQTPDRIQKTEQEISTVLPPRNEYIVDTSEFQAVKARLSSLENGHKLIHRDDQRPTLRRSTQSDTDKPDGKDDGDDRPTLKRRSD